MIPSLQSWQRIHAPHNKKRIATTDGSCGDFRIAESQSKLKLHFYSQTCGAGGDRGSHPNHHHQCHFHFYLFESISAQLHRSPHVLRMVCALRLKNNISSFPFLCEVSKEYISIPDGNAKRYSDHIIFI